MEKWNFTFVIFMFLEFLFFFRKIYFFMPFLKSGLLLKVSLFAEYVQYLKKKNQKPLYEALQKVKEGTLHLFMLILS